MPAFLETAAAPGNSPIDRADPRARVLVATAFSLLVAVGNGFPTLALAAAMSLIAAGAARLRPSVLGKRLLPLNLFMLLLVLVLPWTNDGPMLFRLGSLGYGTEGLLLAARIGLKGNAIVTMLVALLGSLDIITLGHALDHLYVPDKLSHLLLFTVRYLEVFHREYLRLRGAMIVRGFRPGMNLHTYRAFGYLVGMLLVRSVDRSERILAAMKCRGFRGHFYLLDHFVFSASDVWFAGISLASLVVLAAVEWL